MDLLAYGLTIMILTTAIKLSRPGLRKYIPLDTHTTPWPPDSIHRSK